jgi:hypothetical protein
MSNAAPWPPPQETNFREVARSTENPTTKLLAEGLTALAEAVRELDDTVGRLSGNARPHHPPPEPLASATES